MATTDVTCLLVKEQPAKLPEEAIALVRDSQLLDDSNLQCLTFYEGQFYVWQLTKDWNALDDLIQRNDGNLLNDLVNQIFVKISGFRMGAMGRILERPPRFMMLASFVRTMANELEANEAIRRQSLPDSAWGIYGRLSKHMKYVQNAYWYITCPQLEAIGHEWVKLERKLSGWVPEFSTGKRSLKLISNPTGIQRNFQGGELP